MAKTHKLIQRFTQKPKDFTWIELVSLLKMLGYQEMKNAKTGGSRRRFKNTKTKRFILLHQPHPRKILKLYQIKSILEHLKGENLL